ncbi:radical SAM protein [Thermotoga sp. Ku-13t]|uniref:elongator complex protein 3 n=1 Tax=Thermotoga sp. Ku-13t TaxID=1755813 RepID=UPI0013EB2180|nr:radical SAM protein [Thermotoga sp. Ku-13t]KAF2958348.1 radical SAM protein [Thermotoga sp. Ku-13t]
MKILPVFLPQRGCKNRCIFCSQQAITGLEKPLGFEELDELARKYSNTAGRFEIAFYGGTFTAMDGHEQVRYLQWASRYVKSGVCTGIRLSTRPDEIDEPRVKILKENGVSFVELGVQSFDDEVLKLNRRGYTSADVYRACEILKKHGIDFGVHLMVGLVGDESSKDILSARQAVEVGSKSCRVHPTLVLKDSPLEVLYRLGEYTPMDLETAIDVCSDMVSILEGHGVRVIRLGLYVPLELLKNVVAGPLHPRLGELVRTRLVEKVFNFLNASAVVHTHRESSWVSSLDVPKFEGAEFGFIVKESFVPWQSSLRLYAESILQGVIQCSKN